MIKGACMMSDSSVKHKNKKELIPKMPIDPSHPYAHFQGFLILPFIAALLTFLGSIVMVTFQNPSTLAGFDLFIYWTDFAYIPLLIITFYAWMKRKKYTPFLMIFYFVIHAIWNLSYLVGVDGFRLDTFNLAMSIIWVIYFIRSERVKKVFTN